MMPARSLICALTVATCADLRTLLTTGIRIPSSTTMIPMTTRISISVKPLDRPLRLGVRGLMMMSFMVVRSSSAPKPRTSKPQTVKPHHRSLLPRPRHRRDQRDHRGEQRDDDEADDHAEDHDHHRLENADQRA